MSTLTQERLKEVLVYNPETGEFIRLLNRNAGKKAGTIDSSGHRQIWVDSKLYLAHRLAYLYMLGVWPELQIDHKNGCKDDNRWSNLREASHGQNIMNRTKRAGTRSSKKGVTFHASTGKWRAMITAKSQRISLGLYWTEEDAHAAYCNAAKNLHGEFACFR